MSLGETKLVVVSPEDLRAAVGDAVEEKIAAVLATILSAIVGHAAGQGSPLAPTPAVARERAVEPRPAAEPKRKSDGGLWLSGEETGEILGLTGAGLGYLRKLGRLKTRKDPGHKGRGTAPVQYEQASVAAERERRDAAL